MSRIEVVCTSEAIETLTGEHREALAEALALRALACEGNSLRLRHSEEVMGEQGSQSLRADVGQDKVGQTLALRAMACEGNSLGLRHLELEGWQGLDHT